MVPKIAKKLINVAKVTVDNDVVMEFNSKSYYVKDKLTGNRLLQRGSIRVFINFVMI